MYEIIIEESAAIEIEEIYFWYEEKSIGLGNRFKNDLDKKIGNLKTNPQTFSFITASHRRAPLTSFPYLIIYKILQQKVLILSVIYAGRNLEELQLHW